MLICYSNLNIDIVDGGAIYNISDLKRKDISSKTINNIAFKGSTAYLSCGFGIVAINMAKRRLPTPILLAATDNMFLWTRFRPQLTAFMP